MMMVLIFEGKMLGIYFGTCWLLMNLDKEKVADYK